MRIAAAACLATALLVAGCVPEEAPPVGAAESADLQIDPVTGLKIATDWQLVRAACTGCHSARQITQQRGTAEQWLSMIRWMQTKQNLWTFDEETEQRIVAYLAENYPSSAARRRAALPLELMPPNPYRP